MTALHLRSLPRPFLAFPILFALLLVSEGSARAQSSTVESAIDAALEGGMVLLCRHAMTGTFQEREPVDYADTTSQRLLSAEGERQARLMGRAFRTLRVPIARVVSSPMHRARRTAELMFYRVPMIDSIWHTNGNDYSGAPELNRRTMLTTPVARGNLVIISHIGTMRNALEAAPENVGEGDCVVVRPTGAARELVGVVPWRAWLKEAGIGG